MAATSVTGRGNGDSHGKAKPENNVGCGKFIPIDEIEKKVLPSNCCAVKYVCGGSKRITCGGGGRSIKVCR